MTKQKTNWTLIIVIGVAIFLMTGGKLTPFLGSTVTHCVSTEPTTLDGLANEIAKWKVGVEGIYDSQGNLLTEEGTRPVLVFYYNSPESFLKELHASNKNILFDEVNIIECPSGTSCPFDESTDVGVIINPGISGKLFFPVGGESFDAYIVEWSPLINTVILDTDDCELEIKPNWNNNVICTEDNKKAILYQIGTESVNKEYDYNFKDEYFKTFFTCEELECTTQADCGENENCENNVCVKETAFGCKLFD